MMFSGSKGINFRSIFKLNRNGQSSIEEGLLGNVHPEIELSGYGRLESPGSGSESPSGLLNGESLNVELISDLDLFFERLYSYYCEKGLWCIITKWIVELLSLGFTICFSGFFLLFVDWSGLRNAKCGMDAVESGIKPCDLAKEALHSHPLTPFTVSTAIIVGYLGIFFIYWVFCFLRFFAQLREILRIRHFYYNSLHVTDIEIQTMPWATILEKIVRLQSSERLCVVKNLSAQDVVMRLMRKENYLIGMLNKGVLAFPISHWVPGAGPTVKFGSNEKRHRLILTKTLEWTLNWCILQSMFDRNFCLRRDFVSNPRALKKRLMIVGLMMLVLSPFIIIFMLVYLFLRHAEQFYNHPSTASSRRWSNLSKWILREFNEVDHLFKHRINSSVMLASDYLKQFPSPIISNIAKFISFVSGGFAAILIIIAFQEESLLEGHIFGRNLLWYAAVFGTITAISRAAITDELLVPYPTGAMSMVVQHTHYMPKTWRGKENTERVRIEFETLFQYTGMMLLEEMVSIFLTPYLLLFVVPKRVDDILQFIADFTVHVEGVGHVCSFSNFDFKKHGNINYGSPHSASPIERSSQGKMEKSLLSFQSSYPTWEPDSDGKQFLQNLRTFREQNLQGPRIGQAYSSPQRTWLGNPHFRGHRDRTNTLPREMPHYSLPTGYHSDSLWLTDGDEKNHPYLLDWYYTSRPHHDKTIQEDPLKSSEQCFGDYLLSHNLSQNDAQFNDYWPRHYDHRAESSLGASTSATPFGRDSILQNREFGNNNNNSNDNNNPLHRSTRSHWWDRDGRNDQQTQASFLEPPDFSHRPVGNYYGNISERSSEEQETEEVSVWRNSSAKLNRTVYVDDLETGEYNLLFDDVYSKTPETPVNQESQNF